jgi:hypothetical protein
MSKQPPKGPAESVAPMKAKDDGITGTRDEEETKSDSSIAERRQ